MKSGMLAAEAIYPILSLDPERTIVALGECDASEPGIEVPEYEDSLKDSWISTELKEIRNTHAAFHG